ncbi:nicotinate phosphoribosyltransferase [Globicatella sp. PHS-GS-PNBC-21-1553]|uniref:nicotinate phosphoribosyltransferase n=1 Tax=Globicatella sp. PHS-GS-PNBC-21-1553 TaxID=2885764 RepID=UPI00298F087C|nr:nicotinate phosphoribosyltransferase [Globicatella sp. PHS-GS-PNBC-21-1553]WPC09538.1 nicotinate phosphoribosyltransferase [Globicatella sp. PHS-GS-PNBC-21-1553]
MFNYTDDSLSLHTDLYQINMLKTYWDDNTADRHAVFEAYFRKNPFENGYAVFAGLERIVQYLSNLRFSKTDIDYLESLDLYPQEFLDYLRDFKFTCTVRSLVEGELCFANEPLIQIEGPLGQCQIVETAVLNILNFQTLIATKASRIRSVIGENDKLSEFGTRRAQEMEAAIWGTRAAYIGGFDSTSNVRAGKLFGIPVSGTHAHSLVQAYRDEYTAFKKYAESHKNVVFLVDTYDTLRSGVPTAIRVAREMGDKINFLGVRIDSGDMAYQSKKIREQLDEAGFPDAHIIASNDLDEKTILNLRMQGAKIDDWGVGTKIITAFDQPSLGAVYKLVSIEDENGEMVPTMKISSNAEKMSTPGVKQVWRITRNRDGKSEGDYVALIDERPDLLDELFMFHPVHTYINKTVKDFTAKPLLVEVFKEGELVYEVPSLSEVKDYANKSIHALWDEYKRILNPEQYPVDLSQKLYDEKMASIKDIRSKIDSQVKKIEKGDQ